ncbi:MAG: peptidoglycan DD-metalloendopeptidase family protein [Acidimicrobiia bacterium]
MRRTSVLLVVLFSMITIPARAAAAAAVVYRPPVGGPIIDHFRPPATAYGAGNRGIDYRTTSGELVRAAAAGTVTFAGQVGGELHVVVTHDDGLRTSYSFLASVTVTRGRAVAQGNPIGTAAESLHFGVRAGDLYLDPEQVLAGERLHVRLVPTQEPTAAERRLVEGLVRDVLDRNVNQRSWLEPLRNAFTLLGKLDPVYQANQLANAIAEWHRDQTDCTPVSTAPSTTVDLSTHVVVLVAGFGSTSGPTGVDTVAVDAVGYRRANVIRFSYAGGRVPDAADAPDLARAIPAAPYDAADSQQALTTSIERLAGLIAAVRRARPGVRVDVIGHSQGGVVAVGALERMEAPDAAAITTVTIGSPHAGDTLAAVGSIVTTTPKESVVDALEQLVGIEHDSPAALDLAPGSPFMVGYRATPLPAGASVTSIAGRYDPVVTAPTTRLAGAVTTTVAGPPDPVTAHGQLPGHAAVTREIALAVRGQRPTCDSLADRLADFAASDGLDLAETALAVLAGV